jgi:hypothetical protein
MKTPETQKKKILICAEDPDDQFIFKTTCTELDPSASIAVFYTGADLINYLSTIDNDLPEGEDSPLVIVGDIKSPFFGLKDISQIKYIPRFSKTPLCVFAENYSVDEKSAALEMGVSAFHARPGSICQLRLILSDIIKPSAHINERAQAGSAS